MFGAEIMSQRRLNQKEPCISCCQKLEEILDVFAVLHNERKDQSGARLYCHLTPQEDRD